VPLTLPTLASLQQQAVADFNANVEDEDATIRRSFGWALSWVTAGATWGLYVLLDWVADQTIPSRSTGQRLLDWCALLGIVPAAAERATGTVAATGSPGAPIDAGSTLVRADGARYETTADAELDDDGEAAVPIRAITPGTSGNADAGTRLTWESAIAGVDSTASLDAAITDGTDDESEDSLQRRVGERMARRPQGGARADYVLWTREALPGLVDQVWVVGGLPARGQVAVFFSVIYDGADPASVIPEAWQVDSVQEHVEPLIPADCDGFVAAAPTANPINLTIDLVTDTPTVRAAVTAELTTLFQRRGAAHNGTTILNSEIRTAIGRATDQYLLTSVAGDGTGTGNVTQSTGVLPHLGTVTWT